MVVRPLLPRLTNIVEVIEWRHGACRNMSPDENSLYDIVRKAPDLSAIRPTASGWHKKMVIQTDADDIIGYICRVGERTSA